MTSEELTLRKEQHIQKTKFKEESGIIQGNKRRLLWNKTVKQRAEKIRMKSTKFPDREKSISGLNF